MNPHTFLKYLVEYKKDIHNLDDALGRKLYRQQMNDSSLTYEDVITEWYYAGFLSEYFGGGRHLKNLINGVFVGMNKDEQRKLWETIIDTYSKLTDLDLDLSSQISYDIYIIRTTIQQRVTMNYENRDPETTIMFSDNGDVEVNPIEIFENMLENTFEDEDLEFVMSRFQEICDKIDECS